MTTIIKNQIVKQLARFTKNLSPSKISLKFLKGEGELRNLELNEEFLTDLLELPPFIRLTRAVCNKISAKIHWTRLKTDPIRLFLDCVEVDMEMIENVSEDFHLNQPAVTTTAREKPSEYGFAEKVVDGMHVTINSVVMAFKTPTFRATFQMSHLSVHSTDPNWDRASLRNTRIKDENGKEVLTFKQITLGTLRVDADALYKSGEEENSSTSSPLRLITSAAKLNIVIKKKIVDCSVIAARLHAICDDVLWVLTHAQLQAVAGFAKSVVQVVEKCKKSEPAPSVASDDSAQAYNAPNENWNEHIPTSECQTNQTLFHKEDVKETSYRVTTGKIDIHLCDDAPIETSLMDGCGQLGGSMQIVVNKLSFEHYPYHLAFTSRIHWASHNEASLTRAHWVQELFNSYKKVMKEDSKKNRRKPYFPVPEQSVGTAKHTSPDHGMSRNVVVPTDRIPKKPARVYLYECAFVISCDEVIVMPVATNDMTSTSNIPFLCSDKKSLYLPSDMPTLQFDYTLYFYPGQEDARVPQPNLFCQINPLHLTMDNVTCIWFHRFMQSIRSGFAWAEDIITAQETAPRHIDVRIEGLMPKVTLPCPSDANSHYKQYRPQALQIQISSFRVSNTRIGAQFKQSDLVNTLEVFLESQLYNSSAVFPNHDDDVKPLPQMSWLNDFSVSSGIANIECGYCDADEMAGGRHSVVWMLNARQCWCDFVGIEETNGRPRPFIEPFPLNLCICYPIAAFKHRPAQLSLRDDISSVPSEYSQNSTFTPLHRSPSDPYGKQTKPYRKSSSTRSTPLSSPSFAKMHKSRSAASVNIPVLATELHEVTLPGLSPSVSGSEESMSSFTEDSVVSGSIQSIPLNSIKNSLNGKVSESSINSKLTGTNGKSMGDSRTSSAYWTTPFVSSTSGFESDGSGESYFDKDSLKSKYLDNMQDNSQCALSILLKIPDALAIKLDHYQFIFLMRLQESFVTLRDILLADMEKFDVLRRKLQEKDRISSEESAPDNLGILVSLISKGAEVVLLVPAPNDEQTCTESHDHDTSPYVVEPSEAIDADNELSFSIKAGKDYQYSPRDNDRLLGKDDHNERLIVVAENSVELSTGVVAHRRPGSESSSANTSTYGSDYSLLTAGTSSERSCEGRDISTVTITGTALECSVAMKNDDFAFKLLACGCDISERYHENLEIYLNQKSQVSKESRAASKGRGEVRLRYAMGSTIDQTMEGAVENGVASLMVSDVVVPLLMSTVDGLIECVQDEVEAPLPLMPAIIDLKNLRLNITSDTPPRLLSLPKPLPLLVHINQGTITRAGNGEIQINVPNGPVASATRSKLHRTHDGVLVTSDEMIEKLREEGNELTLRVASIRSENVRLLNELQITNEAKENLEGERDKLLVTVQRLTEELVKSNRDYDELQEVIRHLQSQDKT